MSASVKLWTAAFLPIQPAATKVSLRERDDGSRILANDFLKASSRLPCCARGEDQLIRKIRASRSLTPYCRQEWSTQCVRPHSTVEKNEEVYGPLIEIFDRKLVLGEYLVGLSNSFSHHYLSQWRLHRTSGAAACKNRRVNVVERARAKRNCEFDCEERRLRLVNEQIEQWWWTKEVGRARCRCN